MRHIILTLLLLLPISAYAEYLVLYLPSDTTQAQPHITVNPDGSAKDDRKTATLNKYAKEGWRIVGVVGNPLVHVIYLER
jgi:hypothetical protein